MTDVEKRALELINDSRASRGLAPRSSLSADIVEEALCRAIEQHDAFKQEVSDAVEEYDNCIPNRFRRFIIPKPKPDPLVEVIAECDDGTWETKAEYADKFRAALEARGLEIREKGQ